MTNKPIDISKIEDEKELKAIAYDLTVQGQQIAQQLQIVQNRIAQVQEKPSKKEK